MDQETLNRAIEIIQADPKSYGVNPRPNTPNSYSSGGTIQIDDGPVETYTKYNNRIKQEKEQRAIDVKNFNYTDWYNGLPEDMRNRVYESHSNPNLQNHHQQDFDDMIRNNGQEEYDAMIKARQLSPGLLDYGY